MKCFGETSKSCHCKIVFLDDTELLQEIQTSTLGQDLLDVAFRHLNLLETAYFGLRFLDKTNQTHWLDGGKKVTKQLKGADPFTFYFGVKFYASDPCKLLEEITRYQFFLQVKQDVVQERLPVPFELATELAAYAVQSELGDYEPRRHQPGYVGEFKFVVQQTTEFESRVCELHKSLIGQVPAIAELNYLEKVKWLDMYGVDLHPVLGEDNVEYFLGLTPSGVIVLRNKSKVGNYFWPRITKVYFKGKYFMLRVRDKNNDESTYGFELPSKQACKHLWKCCVEHHSFFRLTQVCSPNSGKVFGLTSRFSGRSEKNGHLPHHQFGVHSSRLQPQVVRVASRRYQRRLGQPDGIDSSLKDEKENEKLETRSNISIPQPVHLPKSMSVPALPDSPRSTRSAPWEDPRQRGLFSSLTNPSPRSVRSAGWKLPSSRSGGHQRHRHRSPSVESDDSCDSRRRRSHSHGHHSHRHHRSRRNSDNESEKSLGSKCSHSHSRRHGDRSSGYHHKESLSEVELSQRHRYHNEKPSRSSSNYELIDSEAQWSEVQRQKHVDHHIRKSQSAVIRDLSVRKSGYTNSGMESESEVNYMNRKRHRKHRSRSPPSDMRHSKGLPPEIRKHIAYHLVDPTSENQLKDIHYTNVETETKPIKIRYSPSSSRRPPRSSSSRNLNAKSSACSEMKVCLQSDEDGESPPPPYTPSAACESVVEQSRRLITMGGEGEDGERRSSEEKVSTGVKSSYLYDLDLISNHSKSNNLSAVTNGSTAATTSVVSSSPVLSCAGGAKAGNRKTNSTNNISSGEFGRRIPVNANGVKSSAGPSDTNNHSHRDIVNKRNYQLTSHLSNLTLNGGSADLNYMDKLSSESHVNSSYNQRTNFNCGLSTVYNVGLPNYPPAHPPPSNADVLPPTALVPAHSTHFAAANNAQFNQINQTQMYSNGSFNYLNSAGSVIEGQPTAHHPQYYYPTLPTRGSSNGRVVYPQQLPNGYGHSSIGKASAIANGFGLPAANHIRPQQFVSSHMAAYHSRMVPAANQHGWESLKANGLVNVTHAGPHDSTPNPKLTTEAHHEMSTEL